MPKLLDLDNQRFGRLKTIKKTRDERGRPAYKCICDCGNECVVRSLYLKNGNTKSCGCLKHDVVSKRRKENSFIFHEDYVEVFVFGGKSFIIDKADYDLVASKTWCIKNNGYVYSQSELLHRFILGNPHGVVDHINRNPLDNRRRNLRICTQKENCANTSIRSNNKSGYVGVFYRKERKKYSACTKHNGKNIFIGYFESAEDAAKAYDKTVIKLRGEFAYTNFPHENYEKEVENQ